MGVSHSDLPTELTAAEGAHERGDLPEALRIWERTRSRFPHDPAAFLRAAAALRSVGRIEEAEAILRPGLEKFPSDVGLAVEFGWAAYQKGDTSAALERWGQASLTFPHVPDGPLNVALVLRDLHRYDEAETVLAATMARFPDDPTPTAHHATLSNVRGDWIEASARWDRFRLRFPEHPAGYIGAAWAFRGRAMYELAEILLAEAEQRFPDIPDILRDRAHIAHDRGDWDEAARRWARLRGAAPGDPSGFLLGAKALLACSRHEEAVALLAAGRERFPDDARFYVDIGEAAGARGDWGEALRLWTAARRRFPLDRLIQERLFEARMRLIGDTQDGEVPADAEPVLPEDRRMGEIMMACESLGGARFGCEFGGVQRAFGAEPLGLLRWADADPIHIIPALEQRFEGVGLPENTEVFTYPSGMSREYGIRDTRFNLATHTFVNAESVPAETMLQNVCRRQQFLRRKLIDDLESGAKLFVYKVTYTTLTDDELTRLHAAVRSYGPATLLYVRYSDADHPDGTVERVKPGLLVGYLDHFTVTADEKMLTMPVESWGQVCERAYALWRSEGDGGAKDSRPVTARSSGGCVPGVEQDQYSGAQDVNEEDNAVIESWCLEQLAPWLLRDAAPTEVAAEQVHLNRLSPCVFIVSIKEGRVSVADKPSGMVLPQIVTDRVRLYLAFFQDVVREHRLDIDTTFVLDVGDGGLESTVLPVFLFQKPQGSTAVLIPDIDFLGQQFYERDEYADARAYADKSTSAVFVGSTTGAIYTQESVRALAPPRLHAAEYFRNKPDVTFMLTHLVQCDSPETEALLRSMGFGDGRYVKWREQFRHKLVLSMDGNGATCSRVVVALKSNSALVKYASSYVLYYFSQLVPWCHYIPVTADADVERVVEIERSHPGVFEPVARQGRMFAERFLNRHAVQLYVAQLLRLYAGSEWRLPYPRRLAVPRRADGTQDEPVRIEYLAHVQNLGDVLSDASGWAGSPGSTLHVEGLLMFPVPEVPPGELVYQVVPAGGAESSWASAGEFCGSTGALLPIVGFRICLLGASAERFRLTYSATFIDGSRCGPLAGGELCGTTTLSPVEAVSVALVRICAGAPDGAAIVDAIGGEERPDAPRTEV